MKIDIRFAALLLTGASAAQNIAPEEARLEAAPYFPKPPVVIRVGSNLVEIGVVVRDSRGHPVGGLGKEDFEVRDEGKRREITAFTVQQIVKASPVTAQSAAAGATAAPSPARPPRWVAMVFDDISTPADQLFNAKNAAKQFLRDGLAVNDRIGVFTTSGGEVLQFTADTARIGEAVDHISNRERDLTSRGCPLLTPYDAYLIANNLDPMALTVKALEYMSCSGVCPGGGGGSRRGGGGPTACSQATDAVLMMSRSLWENVRLQSQNNLRTLDGIVSLLTGLQGGRVILLASSGFLSNGLEYSQEQLTDKALHGNVVINSLDAKGLYALDLQVGQGAGVRSTIYQQLQGTRPKEAQNDVMAVLSEATGGLFLHNRNDLDAAFKELGMQPEVSYLIGIAPETLDGKYHRLKVGLTGSRRFALQARKGYMASAAPKPSDPPPASRLDSEVYASDTIVDAPVTASTSFEKAADGKTMAHLIFHVDVGQVRFQLQEGIRKQKFRLIAVLFDNQGGFVKGFQGQLEFALKDASFAQLAGTGFNADFRVTALEGSYRLRTVAIEGDDNGRYAAATQAAEFH